jgi:hypothetical protein
MACTAESTVALPLTTMTSTSASMFDLPQDVVPAGVRRVQIEQDYIDHLGVDQPSACLAD